MEKLTQKNEFDIGELSLRVSSIEREMREVLARNIRVDGNKTWETSRTRLFAVTVITYVTMILVFLMLGSAQPLLDAFVPTTGFFSIDSISASGAARVGEEGIDIDLRSL